MVYNVSINVDDLMSRNLSPQQSILDEVDQVQFNRLKLSQLAQNVNQLNSILSSGGNGSVDLGAQEFRHFLMNYDVVNVQGNAQALKAIMYDPKNPSSYNYDNSMIEESSSGISGD